MMAILFFLAEPDEIVEKVALQLGCSTDEAIDHMEFWNRVAVETFHVGNDISRAELN